MGRWVCRCGGRDVRAQGRGVSRRVSSAGERDRGADGDQYQHKRKCDGGQDTRSCMGVARGRRDRASVDLPRSNRGRLRALGRRGAAGTARLAWLGEVLDVTVGVNGEIPLALGVDRA